MKPKMLSVHQGLLNFYLKLLQLQRDGNICLVLPSPRSGEQNHKNRLLIWKRGGKVLKILGLKDLFALKENGL